MRILILGAGALGGLVGAQLTRAGEDVTLLETNRARARLLGDDGLLISRIGEAEACVPLHVVSSADGLAPFGLVFVAVKSYETAAAVRGALPACDDETLFLSLQNGVGNAEAIATLVDPSITRSVDPSMGRSVDPSIRRSVDSALTPSPVPSSSRDPGD